MEGQAEGFCTFTELGITRPKPISRRCTDSRQQVQINESHPNSVEAILFEERVEFVLADRFQWGQRSQKEDHAMADMQAPCRKFTSDKRVVTHPTVADELLELCVWLAKMVDPDRCVGENHQLNLRRGGTSKSGIVPPISAS